MRLKIIFRLCFCFVEIALVEFASTVNYWHNNMARVQQGGGQTKHVFPLFSGFPSHKEYVPLNQVWGLSVTSFRNIWVKRRQIFCFEILSLSYPLKYMDKRSKTQQWACSAETSAICYIWEKISTIHQELSFLATIHTELLHWLPCMLWQRILCICVFVFIFPFTCKVTWCHIA